MSLVRAFTHTITVAFRLLAVNPFAYMQIVLQPLVFGGVGLLLFTLHSEPFRLQYAILGGGLVGLWSMTLFTGGNSIGTERWFGTLEEIFSCPTPLPVIAAGKIAAAMGLGAFSFILNLGVASVLFHHAFPQFHPLPFAIAFVVMLPGFFSVAMLLAPIFAVTRSAFLYANAMEFPIYLIAGFMFPLALLPGWTHPLSILFPPSYAVQSLFAAAGAGEPTVTYLSEWASALLLTAIYLLLARWAFAFADGRARREGELAAI